MKPLQLPKGRFTERLIAENGLAPGGFESWVFRRAMLFNAPDKWWGDHGRRDFPHEGIDLCLYRGGDRRIRRLVAGTRIPAMHDGAVKAVFKDYLGHAVIIEGAAAGATAGRLLFMYAHTVPLAGIEPGTAVKTGDIIAAVAATDPSKAKILPHLHFSLGLAAPHFSYRDMVWNFVRDTGRITLLDPLPLLDWPHAVLPERDAFCRAP